MDCIVQQPNADAILSSQDNSEEVTFLYKLCNGSSPKSYGINVARLAGLPPFVIALALQQSKSFESLMQNGLREDDELLIQTQAQKLGEIENHRSSSKIQAVFERLVSIVSCEATMPITEWIDTVKEIWTRYRAVQP
jgi:DNA mismatch repair ATPase MutS